MRFISFYRRQKMQQTKVLTIASTPSSDMAAKYFPSPLYDNARTSDLIDKKVKYNYRIDTYCYYFVTNE